MRKVLAYAALGVALSVSLSPVAGAQGGQGRGGFGQGRGFGGGGLFMLRSKEVQSELKMTEAQVAKLDAKQQELQEQMRELRPGGGGGDRPTREEMQAMMAKRQELQSKAVADILDTKQMKRYKQLELQQSGVQAFQRKDVSDELKITADQQTKIRDIQQAQREEMRNSGGGFNPNATPEEQQAFFKKMQDMQKATSDKIIGTVLTDAQRKQWKEMQGEPFKFPPFQFGGPGGRRGGGGNPPPAPPVA